MFVAVAQGYEPSMSNEVTPQPEKDPQDWVTAEEPMTGPQESYLRTLAQEAGEDLPAKRKRPSSSMPSRNAQGEGNPADRRPTKRDRVRTAITRTSCRSYDSTLIAGR